MFVGCFEISISAVVNKHVQSVGIIRAFCLTGGTCYDFQCLGSQKNLLGCGLLGGSVPRLTLWHFLSSLIPKFIGNVLYSPPVLTGVNIRC